MKISLDENLFKQLWPYIQDDNVTDIRWNGRQLWVEDLIHGRRLMPVMLDHQFLDIFTSKISHMQNVNFNESTRSLQASTDELRIHCIHYSHTGDGTYSLSIRKIPAVARINRENIIKQGYADQAMVNLLGALVRSRSRGIVIGDPGAGKTELLKYLASFVPANESMMTIEDTLEMKLPRIYPDKDITSVLIDDHYTAQMAIRDALRLETKFLWNAEARGREIERILETASTGCCCWTTIHCENTWNIPDRMVQMAGGDSDKEAIENDCFTFFDVGIKVKKIQDEEGIHRRIDQVCVFDRTDNTNHSVVLFRDGMYTGRAMPKELRHRLLVNGEKETLDLFQEMSEKIRREKIREKENKPNYTPNYKKDIQQKYEDSKPYPESMKGTNRR